MEVEIDSLKDLLLLQMSMALEYAVSRYGKEGGPWNVPGSRGSWLSMAKGTLELYGKVLDLEMEESSRGDE